MYIIRTAEAFARLLATHPGTELQTLLQAHADRLAEYADYDLSELGMFGIVEPTDRMATIDTALGWSLLDSDGSFSRPVEFITMQGLWFEAVTILDDTGYGLALYVPIDESTDRTLLAACEQALIEAQQSD